MVSCASARGYALGLTSAMASVGSAAVSKKQGRNESDEGSRETASESAASGLLRTRRRVFFAGHARITRALLKTHVKLHCLLLAQLRGDREGRLSSGLGGGCA